MVTILKAGNILLRELQKNSTSFAIFFLYFSKKKRNNFILNTRHRGWRYFQNITERQSSASRQMNFIDLISVYMQLNKWGHKQNDFENTSIGEFNRWVKTQVKDVRN